MTDYRQGPVEPSSANLLRYAANNCGLSDELQNLMRDAATQLERADAALREVGGLPDKWVNQVCANQLRAILAQYVPES